MKAIVQNGYGSPDVLELKEIDKPVVKDDGVLVRVHAAGLHAGDYFVMRGAPYLARFAAGWPKPKDYVPGFDAAGHVEAVGKNVRRFQPGDEVFGACRRRVRRVRVCCGRQVRAEAGQPHVRASRGRTDLRTRRPPRSSRRGKGAARAEGPDQWCVGRRGHVRRADRASPSERK